MVTCNSRRDNNDGKQMVFYPRVWTFLTTFDILRSPYRQTALGVPLYYLVDIIRKKTLFRPERHIAAPPLKRIARIDIL